MSVYEGFCMMELIVVFLPMCVSKTYRTHRGSQHRPHQDEDAERVPM